ncbi:LOW QUALITY PROTEIN: 60S acidic ribosomal protein P0-like [Vigna umbellata]|uniref:LOW QUALITY PROTEIN: 60S acidic ribosomal protein P0-like n=1 Tax=Vigna umbellata TaxID=87088 RepID=UPI001F5EA56A|nr:LOW QUALITY PROTEIN: 60S acidic ribosomal protein P0-like [Vigna umbellata]
MVKVLKNLHLYTTKVIFEAFYLKRLSNQYYSKYRFHKLIRELALVKILRFKRIPLYFRCLHSNQDSKVTVEIITPVELIRKGEKVGSSEAALLAKLGIRPFSYGLVVLSVYDNGSVFSPEVLDLTEDDLLEKFCCRCLHGYFSFSLAISYPTLAAAPHMFVNAYKNVLAVAVETDYSFPEADKVKEYLKDPSKFAVAAVAASCLLFWGSICCAKEEEKKEEPAEESDDDMGFSLFD